MEQRFINENYTKPGCLNVLLFANNGSGKTTIEVEQNLRNSEKFMKYRTMMADVKVKFSATEKGWSLRSKLSKANWKNPEYRKKMITACGNVVVIDGVTYDSVNQASLKLNISRSTIQRASHREISKGSNLISSELYKVITKKVFANGIVYQSVNDCALAHGLSACSITKRCQSPSPVWKDYFYL